MHLRDGGPGGAPGGRRGATRVARFEVVSDVGRYCRERLAPVIGGPALPARPRRPVGFSSIRRERCDGCCNLALLTGAAVAPCMIATDNVACRKKSKQSGAQRVRFTWHGSCRAAARSGAGFRGRIGRGSRAGRRRYLRRRRRPCAASAPVPIPDSVGFQGFSRARSEDVRRALAECCATAYGVASCIGSVIPALRAGPH